MTGVQTCALPILVRRALEGQVQGHLRAQLPGARDEGDEVLDAAQLGVDGVVPAVGRADAVGRTGIPHRSHGRQGRAAPPVHRGTRQTRAESRYLTNSLAIVFNALLVL